MPAPDASGPQVPTPAGTDPSGVGRTTTGARWPAVLGAVLIGAGVGILGTVLHAHFAWLGEAVVPWGAVLALVLVAAAQLWWTLRTHLPWSGGVCAVAAFTTAVVLSAWPGLDTFAVALNEYTLRVVPGPAIAGAVWLWGIPVVAVITMLVAQPLLRAPANRD